MIFALRPKTVVPIQLRVDELLAQNRLVTTGIVELEILSGMRTEKEFHDFKLLLEGLHRVRTRESDWASAAEMAFALRRAGAGIVHADRDFTVLCRHFRIEQEDFSDAAKEN